MLAPETLVAFLATSHEDEWKRLSAIHGAEVARKVVETVARNRDERGMLDCLRHGVTDRGVKLRLAIFRPAVGAASAGDRPGRTAGRAAVSMDRTDL